MANSDPEGHFVTITLLGVERTREICAMLRGLLFANGNSNGQSTKDMKFKRGVAIEFGTPPMAEKFIADVNALFRKRIRRRLVIIQHK